MKRKISLSIFLTSLGVMIISLALVLGFLYNYFGNIETGELKNTLTASALAVENEGKAYLEQLAGGSERFTLIAADGTVLYDTDADASAMENHADREEVREALTSGSGESQRYSQTLMRRTIYCAVRLKDGSVLRISIESASVLDLIVGMLYIIALIVLLMAVFSAFAGKKLSGRIIEPLDSLDLNAPLDNEDAYPELSPLLRRIDAQNRELVKQAASLQRNLDEQNGIIGNMNEGLVLLDDRQKVLVMNKAAARIFGCSACCKGTDFILIDRKVEVAGAINEALRSGRSELECRRGNETYRLSVSRVQSAGRTVGTVILMQDITETLRAEQSRREFTANVSHELKTPLQNIIGRAELVQQDAIDPADRARFAKGIGDEARRMALLVDDILCLSGLDEGKTEPRVRVCLGDEVRRAVETLTPEAQKRGIKLNISAQNAVINAPRTLVYEIILNLCSNAVRYNTANGKVMINVSLKEDSAVLTVRDTGIGIPPEDLNRIFERFYRVDKSRSRLTGGTGLGLSIVKHACGLTGAQISVQSTVGQGSAFTVTFPDAEPETQI